MQARMQRWMDWMKELADRGYIKNRGLPLERAGSVVRANSVTDGPYCEKDLVIGYTLIEANDLADASDASRSCPVLADGGAVEVRPVMNM
jgi:hypothetical protein